MGLNAFQGSFLSFRTRTNGYESAKYNKDQRNRTKLTNEESAKPSRTSAEIKKELEELDKKIESLQKYKTWSTKEKVFNYVVRLDLTTQKRGSKYTNKVTMANYMDEIKPNEKFIGATINLGKKGLKEISPETLKNLEITDIEDEHTKGLVKITVKDRQTYKKLAEELSEIKNVEHKEKIMTPELKKLYAKQSKLREEHDDAVIYEAEQMRNARRESISTKSLPIDTLLANNGITINRSSMVSQLADVKKGELQTQIKTTELLIKRLQQRLTILSTQRSRNPRNTVLNRNISSIQNQIHSLQDKLSAYKNELAKTSQESNSKDTKQTTDKSQSVSVTNEDLTRIQEIISGDIETEFHPFT